MILIGVLLSDSIHDVVHVAHGYLVINRNNAPTLRRSIREQEALSKEGRIPQQPLNDDMIQTAMAKITRMMRNEPTDDRTTVRNNNSNNNNNNNNSDAIIKSSLFLSRPESSAKQHHHFAPSSITTENIIDDPSSSTFSPLEAWCLSKLDRWYTASQTAKCPFFRRRVGDSLDTLEEWVKYTIIRKECWPMMGPPQAHRPAGTNKKRNKIKYKGLSPTQLQNYVSNDWKADTKKGYYITGKLTTAIYRDDCLFLGPDPDLPCSGLRKYAGVASHLFDYHTSFATLKSLETITKNDNIKNVFKEEEEEEEQGEKIIALVARWKLIGVLRLPWRPSLPTLSGQTIYHIDNDGLIACHEESWDRSALEAFGHTFLPKLANRIWPNSISSDDR